MSYNENFIINFYRMLNVLINFHTNCIKQIKNSRSLTLAENNIGESVKERVLFKN